MKLMPCPVNGLRALEEFAYGGELRTMPDPDRCSDEEWADYVFNRSGAPGIKREWWLHIASGVWFIAERDTERDIVLRSWMPGEEPGSGAR